MLSHEEYLTAYDNLAAFMQPITKRFCSPCISTRREFNGPYACCLDGCFSNIEDNSEVIDTVPKNNHTKCRYLGDAGCAVSTKPLDCLVYICEGIDLSEEQRLEYSKLCSLVRIALQNKVDSKYD